MSACESQFSLTDVTEMKKISRKKFNSLRGQQSNLMLNCAKHKWVKAVIPAPRFPTFQRKTRLLFAISLYLRHVVYHSTTVLRRRYQCGISSPPNRVWCCLPNHLRTKSAHYNALYPENHKRKRC